MGEAGRAGEARVRASRLRISPLEGEEFDIGVGMDAGKEAVRALLEARAERAEAAVRAMGGAAVQRLRDEWPAWVHEGQQPPEREDWRVWLMMAGRGFGKTRAGAEWVSALARAEPRARIALVAGSIEEARALMVEGPSGLIAVARAAERRHMLWQPTRRRLRFASGAQAFLYSGAKGDGLRGPEHHYAWCDELAKWDDAENGWSNLMLGLRLGGRPRALVTTTPRAIELIKAILGDEETERTGGASSGNPHLSKRFLGSMERQMGGTRLGRQELGGELIEDLEEALWPRKLIEACRVGPDPTPLRRVVIGVDPPAGVNGDACGIVAAGVDGDGIGYVLGDHSVAGLSPEGWARKVAAAAEMHRAQRVVAESNNGGKMVESVLRAAGVTVPVRLVHAADGKVARAAPVAALFECGRTRFAGRFPELEDELAGLDWGGRYEGPGRSPDRADAMVWALTHLMLGKAKARLRIRTL